MSAALAYIDEHLTMPSEHETGDHFTGDDRKELTRQGIVLDFLKTEIATKANRAELQTNTVLNHEERLKAIEIGNAELRGALKVIMWVSPIMGSAIGAIVSLVVSHFLK